MPSTNHYEDNLRHNFNHLPRGYFKKRKPPDDHVVTMISTNDSVNNLSEHSFNTIRRHVNTNFTIIYALIALLLTATCCAGQTINVSGNLTKDFQDYVSTTTPAPYVPITKDGSE
jgi:hypothetical protein